MVVSNVVEPKVFGRSMELHPVVVLLSFAFWGALWGVMGCVLSIPLTVTIRIVWTHWRAKVRTSSVSMGIGGDDDAASLRELESDMASIRHDQ